MEQASLENLRVMLKALGKNQADTARIVWNSIQWDAKRYLEALSDGESKMRAQPWEVQRELDGLGRSMRDLARRLQQASSEVLREIENKANYQQPEWAMASRHERKRMETPRGADPFPWFKISRYSSQSDGSWEQEEPEWGHDAMRPYELAEMAAFLDDMAQKTAEGKAAPNGKRVLKPATQAKREAKERMIGSLDFEIVWMDGRAKSHTLPIVQTIHRWATGEPVGKEWGLTELERNRKRLAEDIRRQVESEGIS